MACGFSSESCGDLVPDFFPKHHPAESCGMPDGRTGSTGGTLAFADFVSNL
jgi:hypothetical protein